MSHTGCVSDPNNPNEKYILYWYDDSAIIRDVNGQKVGRGADVVIGAAHTYGRAQEIAWELQSKGLYQGQIDIREACYPTPKSAVENCNNRDRVDFIDVHGICYRVPDAVPEPVPEPIPEPVPEPVPEPIPISSCTEGSQKCVGNTGFTCINGSWIATHSCGAEVPPPEPVPAPAPELYEIQISTLYAPELKPATVELLRNFMLKSGYGLSNIRPYGSGYIAQVEKFGSLTLSAIIAIIVAVLALVGITVWNIKLIKDNNVIIEGRKTLSEDLAEIDQMYRDGIIDVDTWQNMRNKLMELYTETLPPENGGGFFDIDAGMIIGVAAIALALSKS